jgi:prepilin-type processing-associated H-X9-DG protein
VTVDGGLGAFVGLRALGPAEIRDGLSATIGAAEKLLGGGRSSFSARLDFWYSGSSALGPAAPDQMAAICGAQTGVPPAYYTHSGATWFAAGYENSWYNHILLPNAATPDCSKDMMEPGLSPTSGGALRASSYHPGGVNVMYMDGSVRFVTDSVDLALWRAASTRAHGESLGIPGE